MELNRVPAFMYVSEYPKLLLCVCVCVGVCLTRARVYNVCNMYFFVYIGANPHDTVSAFPFSAAYFVI